MAIHATAQDDEESCKHESALGCLTPSGIAFIQIFTTTSNTGWTF